MQETQQVEEMESEIISLNEFIPYWTYASLGKKTPLEQDGIEKELGINIGDGARCIVGEAHGGDNYDDCKDCRWISLGDIINGHMAPAILAYRTPKMFMQVKKELYSHMIDEHPQKMRR